MVAFNTYIKVTKTEGKIGYRESVTKINNEFNSTQSVANFTAGHATNSASFKALADMNTQMGDQLNSMQS